MPGGLVLACRARVALQRAQCVVCIAAHVAWIALQHAVRGFAQCQLRYPAPTGSTPVCASRLALRARRVHTFPQCMQSTCAFPVGHAARAAGPTLRVSRTWLCAHSTLTQSPGACRAQARSCFVNAARAAGPHPGGPAPQVAALACCSGWQF